MKRTDITDLFPDATDEQINKLMNINGGDINKAKGDLDALKNQLQTTANELEALKNGKPNEDAITALQNELDGLKRAESLRVMREKVSTEKKIPANLLTGETEEACVAQADAILSFASQSGYPALHDGGEANHTPRPQTRDKFAEWAKDNL